MLKSFGELPGRPVLDQLLSQGETRSSALGYVPADGGLYKAYLIRRAEFIHAGQSGETLRTNLLAATYPKEPKILRIIQTSLTSPARKPRRTPKKKSN